VQVALQDHRGPLTLDVSFTLAAGWSVLFGPSGSGKSTILRLIAGLDQPRAGRVVFLPETPGSVPRTLTDTVRNLHVGPEHRRVRLLSQRPALFPHLSVLGNLNFATRHQPAHSRSAASPRADTTRLDRIVALCGIAPLLGRKPSALSGGERQRVALARTLLAKPIDLLLLDEPFTGLGAGPRDTLIHDLRAWLAPHATPVLLVTHDLGEVFASGGNVMRLEGGRIQASGPAETVLAPERAAMLQRMRASEGS